MTLDEAWAEAEAALPEGWMLRLFDYGPSGPFNPGPGESYHVPRYEASSKLGVLSSPPKMFGRSDDTPAAALHALAIALRTREREAG